MGTGTQARGETTEGKDRGNLGLKEKDEMELFTAATTGGIITLIINGVAYWIREWRKHRTWQSNGKDLKAIRGSLGKIYEKIDKVDEKVDKSNLDIGKVQTAQFEQKNQCTQTVNRFDTAIRDQNKELIAIAKRK